MDMTTAQTPPLSNASKKLMVGVGLAILVILVGGFLIYRASTSGLTASVQITSKGFQPAVLRVKPGTKVTWSNTDSSMHQIASNPYPANNSLKALSSGGLEPSQSYSYTFNTTGTVGYHDQDNPTTMLAQVVVAK